MEEVSCARVCFDWFSLPHLPHAVLLGSWAGNADGSNSSHTFVPPATTDCAWFGGLTRFSLLVWVWLCHCRSGVVDF